MVSMQKPESDKGAENNKDKFLREKLPLTNRFERI